jgi:signal peptidase
MHTALRRELDAAAPPRPATSAARTGGRAGRVRDALLGVVAVFGTLTVAWLGIAWLLGLSVVVFVTGSMAPVMPTGAAAVVQRVNASSLAIGDVVTVPRPRTGTPVTHRIVDIDAVPDRPGVRSLTLQGDANAVEDSDRYEVAEADRVIASAPYVGTFVLWAKHPGAMLGASVLIAGVIVWALWPGGARRRDVSDDRQSSVA